MTTSSRTAISIAPASTLAVALAMGAISPLTWAGGGVSLEGGGACCILIGWRYWLEMLPTSTGVDETTARKMNGARDGGR